MEIVYLKEDYCGDISIYDEDIAIIVLKNLIYFSNSVAPVCIDWNGNYNEENGDLGKVGSCYYLNIKIVIYCTYHYRPLSICM